MNTILWIMCGALAVAIIAALATERQINQILDKIKDDNSSNHQ